ncbi:hypothetical protein [Halosegnis sp.]|uniref:hypothetical protein n=1 Tax=Halosegnis sp. TaxID=2864959 RepID=UPI0035D42FC9
MRSFARLRTFVEQRPDLPVGALVVADIVVLQDNFFATRHAKTARAPSGFCAARVYGGYGYPRRDVGLPEPLP